PDERHGHGHRRPDRLADGGAENRAPGPAEPAFRFRRVRRAVPATVRLRPRLSGLPASLAVVAAGYWRVLPVSWRGYCPACCPGKEKPPPRGGGFGVKPLAMTYSCMAWATLPVAQLRFTSEFGMGSGGSTALWSPGKGWRVARMRAASRGVGSSEVEAVGRIAKSKAS